MKGNFRSESESVETYSCRLFWLRSSQKCKDKTVVFFSSSSSHRYFNLSEIFGGQPDWSLSRKEQSYIPLLSSGHLKSGNFCRRPDKEVEQEYLDHFPLEVDEGMSCRHRRITFEGIFDPCPILSGPSCELLLPCYLNRPESQQIGSIPLSATYPAHGKSFIPVCLIIFLISSSSSKHNLVSSLWEGHHPSPLLSCDDGQEEIQQTFCSGHLEVTKIDNTLVVAFVMFGS